ncbi:hypothetical protein ACFSNO_03005 [Streptomyces cirratus]
MTERPVKRASIPLSAVVTGVGAAVYVRCALSAIDNNHPVVTAPKTRSSRGWGAISPRVTTALRNQEDNCAHRKWS